MTPTPTDPAASEDMREAILQAAGMVRRPKPGTRRHFWLGFLAGFSAAGALVAAAHGYVWLPWLGYGVVFVCVAEYGMRKQS